MTVRAPAIQAQLLETFLLLTINHQSLIATKANRVVRAADGRTVLEFGSRRAQGADAAVLGARAAYIGGCGGTACVLTDQIYGVPAAGTMAHAWVQMFPERVRGLQGLLRDISHERRAAGGHLRHPAPRRARRHTRLQRGAQAARHNEVRHPARLRRPRLSHAAGAQDARRGRLDGAAP